MKYFVGLDVSLAETAVCIVDENNVILKEGMVPSHPEDVADYLDAVKKSEICKRLMTVPGVGAITAITYVTTIDDPDRFARSRDVGPHLGLVPKKYASGETDRNSGISKSGDSAMRTVLYQAALALLTRSTKMSSLRSWGLSVAKRRGLRRAIIAVARKLAIVMHRVWADGSVFRWSKEEPPVAA